MKTAKLIGMILAAMMVSVASAGVTTYLPTSSHYMGMIVDTNYDVRIEFAVYDTETNPDEYAGDIPGDGRFVYAYQVFNLSPDTAFSVDVFSILGIGQGALVSDEAIGSTDDGNGGIAATNEVLNSSKTQAAWTFDGSLLTGNQSFFLLLSSDYDYVTGSYNINTSDFVTPGVPEPASILLLAAGGVLFVRKR